MTKLKKLSAAIVSVLLASTMCLSFTACDDNSETSTSDSSSGTTSSDTTSTDSSSSSGSQTYVDIYGTDTSSVTLNLAIGHNSTTTSTSYLDLGANNVTMVDGNQYSQGDFKPAWQGLASAINVRFNDVYAGKSTSGNLSNALTLSSTSNSAWANTDIITTDLSEVTDAAAEGTSFLNLGEYLDSMPNFKAYLEANPVVEYSIVSNVASDGTKTIYVSPYFDGNDDIERYFLARQDWVDILLGKDSTLSSDGATWASVSGTSGGTAVEAYMQTTGTLAVEVTDTSDATKTKTIYKNYANVLSEIAKSSSDLHNAYYAIANAEYSGESGNIVDIQNAALKANSNATGKQLVALVRAYIAACYTTTSSGSTSYYEDPADLFNGADAAWDVDDLVALLRCVITNNANLSTKTVAGLFTRTAQNDRTPDMLRMAGQLYGVRGTDSRYEYTYISADGELLDARNDAELWEALEAMNTLYDEGLIYTDNFNTSVNTSSNALTGGNSVEGFMMFDYVQTQTLNGFYVEDTSLDSTKATALGTDYYLSPVLNPLAKWTVDDEDPDGEIMRFCESWRSVKTSGIAINGAVKDNPAKLAACLKLVDYLFSNDGMILMTYGPQASADGEETSTGGWWYNEEATNVSLTDVATLDEVSGQYTIKDEYKSQYFVYQNKVYTGTYYKGKTTPTVSTATLNAFKNKSSVGATIKGNTTISGAILNFTNFARYIIGSTLPVAVKDQSFEYQLTSAMGKAGADNVGNALVNGVIKGMTISLDTATYGDDAFWYMVVPTGLPLTTAETTSLNTSTQNTLKYITGTLVDSSNKNVYSVFMFVIMNGLEGGTYTSNSQNWTVGTSAEDMVSKMSAQGSITREGVLDNAWQRLVSWYGISI